MAPLPFDAVLFDCDGVLVDSEPITHRVLVEALHEIGWPITAEESMHHFLGRSIREEAALILEKTGFAITPAWLQSFRARRDHALAHELVAIPGAPGAVRALHAQFDGRIACASGADRGKVELQLARVGLLELFEGRIFSGEDMPRSKPSPDVYLAAAAALGVAPARCVVVEDTVTGATAGKAAGATVIGYCPGGPGHASAQAMRELGVEVLVHDMAQLPLGIAQYRSATAPT